MKASCNSHASPRPIRLRSSMASVPWVSTSATIMDAFWTEAPTQAHSSGRRPEKSTRRWAGSRWRCAARVLWRSFLVPCKLAHDGRTQISVDIPDFAGQVRLMAVAYSQHGLGRGERTMLIRDPVVVDLSLPRFVAPGDSAKLALSLHNTDGPTGTYKLDLSTAGAAALTGGWESRLLTWGWRAQDRQHHSGRERRWCRHNQGGSGGPRRLSAASRMAGCRAFTTLPHRP